MAEKKQIALRLEDAEIKILTDMGEALGVNLQNQIRIILKKAIKEYETNTNKEHQYQAPLSK